MYESQKNLPGFMYFSYSYRASRYYQIFIYSPTDAQMSYLKKTILKFTLTFWRRNNFFNFSTHCIQNVNNTGTKQVIIMKQAAF